MNSRFFFPIRMDSLVLMENMNLDLVAEGLTSRNRAIEAYMNKKAAPGDRKALELVRKMEAWDADFDTVRSCRLEFGEIVDEEDIATEVPLKPEQSPVAVCGMALWWLNSVQGRILPQKAVLNAQRALDAGFDPARGIIADCLLREWIEREALFFDRGEPADWLEDGPNDGPEHDPEDGPDNAAKWSEKQRFDKLACLEKVLAGDPSDPAFEDALLVAGQRLGRTGQLPGLEEAAEQDRARMAALIRQGLKTLAEQGHVDALRMLALARCPNAQAAPETAWARDEIMAKAEKGMVGPMLILAQHLAGLLPTWPAYGDDADNLERANVLFEELANEGDPRAATTLAWQALREAGGREGKAFDRKASSRAEALLADIIRKTGFAPARAMLGAHIYNTRRDWEKAWPLLRDACKESFSAACEAACADFLSQMAENAHHVERVGRGEDIPFTDFVDDAHGSSDLWLGRLYELGAVSRHGEAASAAVRVLLSWQMNYLLDPIHPGGPDSGTCSMDRLLHDAAARFRGRAAVLALVLEMGKEDGLFAGMTLENLGRIVADGAARGMADCVVAESLFLGRKPQKGLDKAFRPWTLKELHPLCEELSQASNLARTAANFMALAELFDRQAEEGGRIPKAAVRQCTARLKAEYDRACFANDTPVFCVLAVLLKKACEDLSPEAAGALLDHVNMDVFGDEEGASLREVLNWMDACLRQKGLWSWRILKGLGLDTEEDFDWRGQEMDERGREQLRAILDLFEKSGGALERFSITPDPAAAVRKSRKARRKRDKRARSAKRKG